MLVNLNTEIQEEMYMKAEQITHDWTTAEGTDTFIFYPALAGKVIKEVLC